MADLDELALALPQATRELSDDGRPAYKVHDKVFLLQLYFSVHAWTIYLGSWWDAEFVWFDVFQEVLSDPRFGWSILRSLFFAVAGLLRYLHYLKYGLSMILIFVGAKMLAADHYHVPVEASLGVVAEQFQTSTHIEEALYRLTEANLALGLISEAQTAAAVLGHNYPNSSWYKQAYELLQKQGVTPQINPGSSLAQLKKS